MTLAGPAGGFLWRLIGMPVYFCCSRQNRAPGKVHARRFWLGHVYTTAHNSHHGNRRIGKASFHGFIPWPTQSTNKYRPRHRGGAQGLAGDGIVVGFGGEREAIMVLPAAIDL